MRICLICVEIFAWGKYGGFGRSTRMLGRELVRRGHEVTAVVPRRPDQKPVEDLDGMKVLSFSPNHPFESQELYRQANAQIYHSQEPSLATYLAQKNMPQAKHVVTFRDPRNLKDWFIEFTHPSVSPLKTILSMVYEYNPWVHRAVRRADAFFSCAEGMEAKARKLYGLPRHPEFLPSPIPMPDHSLIKSESPQVCFVGRWDKRKRPELFLRLAKQRPDVRFIAVGQGQNSEWDQRLRSEYGHLPNVELLGFVDQFRSNRLSEMLEKSWILINTSSREGLPTSFLEALSHRCALLSSVNTSGITERFGYWAQDDDFLKGLNHLLEDNRWKPLAESGEAYVRRHYECDASVSRHEAIYKELILGK